MLAVTRLHQIAHNRNLVLRHGPNLHQIKTLHGILAHSLLLGIEISMLSHQSCWRSYRPGVRFRSVRTESGLLHYTGGRSGHGRLTAPLRLRPIWSVGEDDDAGTEGPG